MNARDARRGTAASHRPVVLVTGANSGIGSATVAALLERGAAVVATVRSADAAAQLLEHLEGDSVDLASLTIEHLDVSDADRAYLVIERHRPDVLVNNAGHALLGAVRDISIDDARGQLDELLLGPTHIALLASTHQIARGEGRIVTVSSVLAEAQIPFTGWYSAAKAGLESVTDALRIELAPAGIHVVTVQCGAVGTDAWEVAGDEVQDGPDPLTAEARGRWADLTDLARPLFGDPADVGSVIADAALDPDPRPIYRVGFGSHLGVLMRSTPKWISDAVTTRVLGLTGTEEPYEGPVRLARTVLHPVVRIGRWGRSQVSRNSLRRLVPERSEVGNRAEVGTR